MIYGVDDAGPSPNDLRLVKVPAMHHEKKSVRPVYPTLDGGYPRLVTEHRGPEYEPRDGQKLTTPLGFIPQVSWLATNRAFEERHSIYRSVYCNFAGCLPYVGFFDFFVEGP